MKTRFELARRFLEPKMRDILQRFLRGELSEREVVEALQCGSDDVEYFGYVERRRTLKAAGKKVPRQRYGFWRDERTEEVLRRVIRDELSEDEAMEILQCDPGDVLWYTNRLKREQDSTYAVGQRMVSRPDVERATIGEGGRLVIPVSYREELRVREGDEVILSLDDGELRIRTPDQALRRAQAQLRRYVPEERSLTDELIAERRKEAKRE